MAMVLLEEPVDWLIEVPVGLMGNLRAGLGGRRCGLGISEQLSGYLEKQQTRGYLNK